MDLALYQHKVRKFRNKLAKPVVGYKVSIIAHSSKNPIRTVRVNDKSALERLESMLDASINHEHFYICIEKLY